jgi:hypothetical protein
MLSRSAAAVAAAAAAAGGSGLDPSNPRKTGGITADGMFRIGMGVAGAGLCSVVNSCNVLYII